MTPAKKTPNRAARRHPAPVVLDVPIETPIATLDLAQRIGLSAAQQSHQQAQQAAQQAQDVLRQVLESLGLDADSNYELDNAGHVFLKK